MLAWAKLYRILAPHGFVRKGTTMFRVHGDGVVQFLKFERERSGSVRLGLGLLSMYGVLKPEWFTSIGWNLRYDVVNIVGRQWDRPYSREPRTPDPVEEQLQILQNEGIAWLDAMQTQQQLAEGICYLETFWGGTTIWNNDLKLAPYLAVGDLTSAKWVAESILNQHEQAYRRNKSIFPDEEAYRKYLEPRRLEDEKYRQVLALIERGSANELREYLDGNYAQNLQYAKFCMKS